MVPVSDDFVRQWCRTLFLATKRTSAFFVIKLYQQKQEPQQNHQRRQAEFDSMPRVSINRLQRSQQ